MGIQIPDGNCACAGQRRLIDHTLLLLEMGDPSFMGHAKQFKLELSWLSHEDVKERVTEIWNKPVSGQNSLG